MDPRVRGTTPDLEFISELLNQATAAKQERYWNLVGEFHKTHSHYDNDHYVKAKKQFLRAQGIEHGFVEEQFARENHLRRKLAAREMRLLRRDAMPGIGRQAQRDAIRRALQLSIGSPRVGSTPSSLFRSMGGAINLRDLEDPSKYVSQVRGAFLQAEHGDFLDEMFDVDDRDPHEIMAKVEKNREAVLRSAETKVFNEKLRRSQPLIAKISRPMSRRDFFRIGAMPARRAIKAPAVVEQALSSATGRRPLLMKLLKAIASHIHR